MDLKRLAMTMKLRKISGTVVHHCAILRKILTESGIATRLMKGYCVSPGEVCEHYWVRTVDEGYDMDIGLELAKLYTPELSDMQTILVEEIPPELENVQVLRHEDNARLYELYKTDPKTFWSESPHDVRTFRSAGIH